MRAVERMRPWTTIVQSGTEGRSTSVNFGDRFYSVAELADVTGYHRDSIYCAIESGALAAATPRGKWLIAGAAINDWLQPTVVATGHSQSAPMPATAPTGV